MWHQRRIQAPNFWNCHTFRTESCCWCWIMKGSITLMQLHGAPSAESGRFSSTSNTILNNLRNWREYECGLWNEKEKDHEKCCVWVIHCCNCCLEPPSMAAPAWLYISSEYKLWYLTVGISLFSDFFIWTNSPTIDFRGTCGAMKKSIWCLNGSECYHV